MNNKIVIWLLNRSRKSNKDERDAFFKRVNDMMKKQVEQEESNMFFGKRYGAQGPHQYYQENQNPYIH